jgi:penicillin-binding protein 1A
VAAALSVLLGVLVVAGVLLYFSSTLPPLDDLARYQPPQVTRLLDRNGVVVADLYRERRTVVPFERIPPVVRQAFLAAEDADFYQHPGMDLAGLLRAFWANLKAGRVVQGGSTITQQVIKTFVLGPERSYTRKIRELLLAFRLESNLTKDQILFLYLNQIYFGHGRHGIQEASRFYFDKDVAELGLAEAAALAALPKSPARYSPVAHPERARGRRNWVLSQMVRNDMIGAEQADEAKDAPLAAVGRGVDFFELAPYYAEHCRRQLEDALGRERLLEGGLRVELALDLDLQRKAQQAMADGLRRVDRRQGYRGPIGRVSQAELERLHRALDDDLAGGRVWDLRPPAGDAGGQAAEWRADAVEWQQRVRVRVPVAEIVGQGRRARAVLDLGAAEAELDRAAVEWARAFSPVRWTRKPRSVAEVLSPGDVVEVELERKDEESISARLSQPPLVQGALVAIEPRTREVVAMVGGSDYRRSSLIRAVQSKRQPGSAFKPVVYAAAVDKGLITPASVLLDTPEVYRAVASGAWKPRNYEREFVGPVTVRHALAHSINTIAVKLASQLGPARIIRVGRDLGITSELRPNLSLALGASEVTPLELTNAYATLADHGRYVSPVFIRSIKGPDGEILNWPAPEQRQALPAAVAYVVTSLLQSVIESGTGRRALRLRRPLAGKTGTANQQRDGWFVGYAPDLACGVWVGFDDHARLGRGWATGAGTALPIWLQFMERGLAERPRREFSAPPGVVFARIDPDNGLLAPAQMTGARFEVFVAGTQPRAVSSRTADDPTATSGSTPAGQEPPLSNQLPEAMFK